MPAIKIPKKFADICTLIRDGKSEGLEKLNTYQGLECQKTAVLAECAYFSGDFEAGLSLDMEICPYWGEWHYSNIRTEHVAAMAFAARLLKREDEVCRFFEEQTTDPAYKGYYDLQTEHIKTGVVPHFTEAETYKTPLNPISVADIRDALQKEKKKLDIDSAAGSFEIFKKCCNKGSLEDVLTYYELVAENNLSTMWHIKALCCYNYMGDENKGFEVVLRMARQRLWYIAAATQVRPMDFFCHPSIFPYLSEKARLDEIANAAISGSN